MSAVNPPTTVTNLLINTLCTSKIVYLPSISTIGAGKLYYIKDICGNAGNSSIYLSTTGLDTFENYSRSSILYALMSTNFQSVLLASDGALNWMILQNYNTNSITTLINFMYTSGYTWYDTRNVTTTTLTDRGPAAYNATMSTVIPAVAGPYFGMSGLAFSAGNTITCPTGYTTGDFTISYWIYCVDKVNTGGTSTYQYIVTGGRLTVHQYFGNANIAYNSGGTVAFSQTGGVWTHLIYVYTTSGTTNITVYKNGTQVATANTSISAAGSFTFGQSSGFTFISYLSDIRIVPFKLTANQALLLYNSYANGSWKFGK